MSLGTEMERLKQELESIKAAISALESLMEVEVQRDPTNQPALEIDTSPDADYGVLAKVLAAAKNADMKKIGFVQN